MRKETLLTLSRLHLRNLILKDSRDENHTDPTWSVRFMSWKVLTCTIFCDESGRPISMLFNGNRMKMWKVLRLPTGLPLPTLLPNDHDPVEVMISRDWHHENEWYSVAVYHGRVQIGHYAGATSLDEAKAWVSAICTKCPIHFTIFDEPPVWMHHTERLPREAWDEDDVPDDNEEIWNYLGGS